MFGSADLTISLTASLIHIDNLLLTVDPVNESYEEIWLVNEQWDKPEVFNKVERIISLSI